MSYRALPGFVNDTQGSFRIPWYKKEGKLRPARDWDILNCRLVTQHYKKITRIF
jgi:hypothetical protein